MSIRIRAGTGADLSFLRAMLYEAAYWRGGNRPGIEAGLSAPELGKLLADWGRDGDLAVVAEDDQEPVGAAWLRFWNDLDHSYGYVSADVPELAIGVVESHRHMGVGRSLMERLLADAAGTGTRQMSLSVERNNPALRLYETLGFRTVGRIDNAYTMVRALAPSDTQAGR